MVHFNVCNYIYRDKYKYKSWNVIRDPYTSNKSDCTDLMLLSCMASHVLFERGVSNALSKFRAQMRSHYRIRHHVYFQLVGTPISFLTFMSQMWLLAHACVNMWRFRSDVCPKYFFSFRAHMRFLFRMHHHVHVQVAGTPKDFPTHKTHMRLLSSMYPPVHF